MARLRQRRRRGAPRLFFGSLFLILIALALFVGELLAFTQREDRLPAGISVAQVRVGNEREDRAGAMIEQAYAEPVVLYYRDNPIVLNPDTVGFRVNVDAMLADATASGEAGGGFWERFMRYLFGQEDTSAQNIPLVADYQTSIVRRELEDIAARYNQQGGRAGYDVQSLRVFSGDDGFQLNMDAALAAVDSALRRPDNRIVELPIAPAPFSQPSLDLLQDLIIAYLDQQGFIYDGQSTVASVYIQDLTTGEEISILGDVAFTAASVVKVPILVDFFRELDATPTQDEAWLMANSLLCSRNSSSNLIMRAFLGAGDQFDGIASVTDTARYAGAVNTYLNAPLVEGFANQELGSIPAPATSPNANFDTNPDPFNQTTAEDIGTLFAMIYDCANHGSGLMTAYPNGEFTPRECQQMLELMSANDLQRLLQGGIPQGVRIAHKNGWLDETVGDAGIVFPPNGRDYVIAVFLWEETGARGFQDHVNLWPRVEAISRAAWNYFSPEAPLLAARQNLPATADDCAVTDANGNITEYNYLPPYGQVDLDDINGWRAEQLAAQARATVAPVPAQTLPTPAPLPTRPAPTLTPFFPQAGQGDTSQAATQ